MERRASSPVYPKIEHVGAGASPAHGGASRPYVCILVASYQGIAVVSHQGIALAIPPRQQMKRPFRGCLSNTRLKSSTSLPMNAIGGLRMPAPSAKVLLVDDSKFLRMANERALSRAGYQVSTAADGEEALQVANDQLPDVILLDMMLPKISGPDVLKALKGNPATRDIPVIVLTSLSQKNEEKLLQEGAAAYFEKSTLQLDKSSERLAATVETVLGQVNRRKKLTQGRTP